MSKAVADGYTGSEASLKTLKSWLRECDKSHVICKTSESALPDRVLEISRAINGKFTIRLVQSNGKEPYVCLSHRWGKSTHLCRTTKDTLTAHLNMIPWDYLPKTFQEAAILTSRMGLKYLWIDSLCIVQDDDDDWKEQAGQMCRIYEGSYVTLAATSSSDSDGGLFLTIPATIVRSRRFVRDRVFIRKAAQHVMFSMDAISAYDDDFPLMSRGWVYQERLLSPRIVHFSNYELSFQCADANERCECGLNQAFFRKHYHLSALKTTKLLDIRRSWNEIVGEYSALRLTYHQDVLAALAGISRQHGTAHKSELGRYLGGLWENTLVHDLLWYKKNSSKVQRPGMYCAPTWSWASTTGSVGVLGTYPRVTDDLEVIDFSVDLAGPDEYGPINAAEIILRGYLTTGTLEVEPIIVGIEGSVNKYSRTFFKHSRSEKQKVYLDYDLGRPGESSYVPPGSKISCLKTGFVGEDKHVCLVLRMVDEASGIFERIGLLQDTKRHEVDNWFDVGQLKETIKVR